MHGPGRNARAFFVEGRKARTRGKRKKEVGEIAAQGFRLNEKITCPECRLISYDGEQLGIYPIADARRIAMNAGLDLVEIAPNSNPPVCRIMDYGKYKYEQAIKQKQARKKQSKIEIKEMKFRPKIDIGDYNTKKKQQSSRTSPRWKGATCTCSSRRCQPTSRRRRPRRRPPTKRERKSKCPR